MKGIIRIKENGSLYRVVAHHHQNLFMTVQGGEATLATFGSARGYRRSGWPWWRR
jgi:hypothetical protein